MANYNYIALEEFEKALIAEVGEPITLETSRGKTCEVERVETSRGVVFSIHGERSGSFGTPDDMPNKAVFEMLLALGSPYLKIDGRYYKISCNELGDTVWYWENSGLFVAQSANEQGELGHFFIGDDF